MRRAVLLTKQVPWPSDSGGRLREAHVADVFRRHFDDVHVLAFGPQPEPGLLPDGVLVHAFARPSPVAGTARARSAAVGRWYSRAMSEQVAALRAPGAHLHAGFSQMLVNAGRAGSVDSVDFHNVESDLLAQRARRHPRRLLRPALAVEARRLAGWERRASRARLVSCVSEPDRQRLAELGVHAVVAANGARLPDAVAPVPAAERVVFVGALDWAPNVEGARWFADEVWPLLRARRPEALAAVVGRAPVPALRALAVPGLSVVADVPDVTPWYADSRLSVCPLLTGGGSRLKVLEALAHGRPVVSTTIGAEGLEDLVGQGVVLADGAAALAEQVARLLADPAACARLGQQGREAVQRQWSWDATLAPLDRALAERVPR